MKRVQQLAARQSEIEAAGALLLIAAQKRQSAIHMPNGDPVAYLSKHPIPFPFLLDEDRRVTRAYGVYVGFNHESINIARPATFVVASDQGVRYVYIGKNQFDRAPIEEVLEAFRSAARGASKESVR
ncbi:MAG TPA: redoxin family protein [Terriglobales bacterium]|jgi:alkyl hydroperoxide reductase subunit AhpC